MKKSDKEMKITRREARTQKGFGGSWIIVDVVVLGEGEKESSGGDDHGSGNDQTLRAQNGRHGTNTNTNTTQDKTQRGKLFSFEC